MGISLTICLYISVFAISILCAYFSDCTKKIWGLVLAFLVLTVVAGFRSYEVGVDTYPYLESIFYRYDTGRPLWTMTSFSTGYAYFTKAILSIWYNPTFLLVIEAAITNGLILARLWDFRNYGSVAYMVFIYVTTAYLQIMCLTCQYLAIAIVFYASRWLNRGHPIIYGAAVLLAVQLHVSAVIGFLAIGVYIVLKKENSVLRYYLKLLLVPLLLVMCLYAYNILMEKYSAYTEKTSSLGLMSFVQLAVFAAMLWYTHLWRRSTETGSFSNGMAVCQTTLLYGLGIIASMGSYFIPNAGRIALYLTVFSTIFYSIIYRQSARKAQEGIHIVGYLLSLWFVLYFVYVFLMHDAIGVLNYSWI